MLCDFCERPGHANENYPLHDVARPQMLLHGIIDDELMFFELPLTGSYKHKMENSCNGLIIVEGGVLTADQLATQLRRLVPVEDFAWEIQHTENNSFRAMFPIKEELEGMKVFGTIKIPNSTC
jgi:hypothetical protein